MKYEEIVSSNDGEEGRWMKQQVEQEATTSTKNKSSQSYNEGEEVGGEHGMMLDEINVGDKTTQSRRKLKKVGPLSHLSTFHYEIENTGIPIIPKPPRTRTRTRFLHTRNSYNVMVNETKSKEAESNTSSVEDHHSTSKHIIYPKCYYEGIRRANYYCRSASPQKEIREEIGQNQEDSSDNDEQEEGEEAEEERQELLLSKRKAEILILQQRRLNMLWSYHVSNTRPSCDRIGRRLEEQRSNSSERSASLRREDESIYLLGDKNCKEEVKSTIQSENLVKRINHAAEHSISNDCNADSKDGYREEDQWVEYWDEEVEANYYYNIYTGEATWVL